jgi:hypothetical protein
LRFATQVGHRISVEPNILELETPRDIASAILGHGDKSDIAAAYGDGYDLSLLAKYMALAVARLEA